MLEELVDKSVYILREVKAQFKHPCVLYSTGKDSTSMLNLIREAFFGEVPFPVIHLDTGHKFREIYQFRDEIAKLWNLDLKVAKSPQFGKLSPQTASHLECCQELKTNTLRRAIEEWEYDAVIVSIRRDEHYMRNMERTVSPRDRDFKWNYLREKGESEEGDAPFEALQPVELWDFVEKDFGDVHHVRVHPILHWRELDIWLYIQNRNLPINPLYRSSYVSKTYFSGKEPKRFRSLGCECCTSPVDSSASTIDEVVEELKTTQVAERAGRTQDKDSQQVMTRLRSMGYMD